MLLYRNVISNIIDLANMSKNRTEQEQHKQLLSLMMRHQHQIFVYIYSLVPSRAEADDIL